MIVGVILGLLTCQGWVCVGKSLHKSLCMEMGLNEGQ